MLCPYQNIQNIRLLKKCSSSQQAPAIANVRKWDSVPDYIDKTKGDE